MKAVGIIGGIGPESTIAYYRLIISACLAHEKDGNYPRIIINSVNMKKMLDLISGNRMDEVAAYLAAEVEKLAAAGADFALLASNTPHIVFDRIQRAASLPLISIVAAACEKTARMGLERVGLFGTRFTMQSGFYSDIFAGRGISVVTPGREEQDYIHDKYMGELVKGSIRENTKAKLLEIAVHLREAHGIQGLVLGGTELPLILKETDDIGIPLLDTTRIHVEVAVDKLFEAGNSGSGRGRVGVGPRQV